MTLQEHYRAIREGAALANVAVRGQISVSGRDRATYLQGLLTNDIQALGAGQGCYTAWLTPQGRMTTDLHVLESGDMMLLDVPVDQTDMVLQRLDQFVFTEDVQLANLTPTLARLSIHGPLAAFAVERTLDAVGGLNAWPQYRNVRASLETMPVVVARIDQLGVPGFTLFCDRTAIDRLTAGLERAGAVCVVAEAVEAARIEAGYPVFGIDLDEEVIPLEAGLESRAISFTKGCYVGQEVIVRVLHRGHGRVVRALMGLRGEGDAPLRRGTRLLAGEKDVGFVTSAAFSPAFGSIGLGYVHRDFFQPGTRLAAEMDGGRRPLTVAALPLRSA
jgi:folate-binding protein YgfZ